MTIRIDKAVREAIEANPTGFDLQVTGADDPEAAERAVAAARDEIAAVDAGPNSAPGLGPQDRNGVKVVAPIRVPGEPGLRIDGGYVPEQILATIPDLVAEHLRAEGVSTARIRLPRKHPIHAIGATPDAIVARIHVMPPQHKNDPPAQVDPAWIDAAVAWVTQGDVNSTVMGQLDLDGFDVSPDQMRPILEEIAGRDVYGSCMFARPHSSGLLGVYFVRRSRIFVLNLAVCSGDLEVRSGALEKLRQVVVDLPLVAAATIDAFPTLVGGMTASHGPLQHHLYLDAADHFSPGPGAVNLLGPHHLVQLGDRHDLTHLPDGRAWLEIRSPSERIAEEEYERVLEEANHVLRSLVVKEPGGRGPDPIAEWLTAMERWR
jgi:hypothetical protein